MGSIKVRFEVLLKTIVDPNGCELFAARVHVGDHVHVFVSALPKVYFPDLLRVFKCISAMVLFVEFSYIKKQLWGGYLWSEGYVVRAAGDVTGARIEEYINNRE